MAATAFGLEGSLIERCGRGEIGHARTGNGYTMVRCTVFRRMI